MHKQDTCLALDILRFYKRIKSILTVQDEMEKHHYESPN